MAGSLFHSQSQSPMCSITERTSVQASHTADAQDLHVASGFCTGHQNPRANKALMINGPSVKWEQALYFNFTCLLFMVFHFPPHSQAARFPPLLLSMFSFPVSASASYHSFILTI